MRTRTSAMICTISSLSAIVGIARSEETKQQPNIGEPISCGYVIVDGTVVPQPYRVAQRGDKVMVNGITVATMSRGIDARSSYWTSRQTDPTEFVALLERHLAWEGTLIVFDNLTPVLMDTDTAASFLGLLVQTKTVEERVQMVLSEGIDSPSLSTAQWRKVLTDFNSTESLEQWIHSMGGSEGEFDSDSLHSESAPRATSTDRTYVLNLVGMLLTVLAIGILLSHPPSVNLRWSAIVDSVEAVGLVRICLVLIIVLAAFDLACTLIANVDTLGEFEELNPVVGILGQNALHISVFKLSSTLLGATLLWYRRRYAGAQIASWWLCLILTLVTARWVIVESLFLRIGV